MTEFPGLPRPQPWAGEAPSQVVITRAGWAAGSADGTLAGITRRSVIELAAEAGDQVQEGRLRAGDLRRAAGLLVTSTTRGIMPVTLVDGEPVGTRTPWPRTTPLRERYWARHEDPGSPSRSATAANDDKHGREHRTPAITRSEEDSQG